MGNVSPGGSASASVVARPSNKEVISVNLSAGFPQEGGEFPAGVHISFNPPLGVIPFASVMNISTSPEVALGAYPFLVTGTSGDAKQVKTYTLIVRLPKPVAKPATGKSEGSASE